MAKIVMPQLAEGETLFGWLDEPTMSEVKYYNDETNVTAGVAAVRKAAEGADFIEYGVAIAILRALAKSAPLCGDAGFNLWNPDELNEIADKLEAER